MSAYRAINTLLYHDELTRSISWMHFHQSQRRNGDVHKLWKEPTNTDVFPAVACLRKYVCVRGHSEF